MNNQPITTSMAEAEREKLILDHIPLLHHVVGRMCFDLPGSIERDDLLGFGMLGLIMAADSFEPERGLQFSTYAFSRIRGSVLDGLRRMDFLPRGRREKVRALDRVLRNLEQQKGQPPAIEEIAEELNCSAEELDEVMHSARIAGCISLDDGPSIELVQMLTDPRSEDPVGSAEWEEMKRLLIDVIDELPEQEKLVITLYYGEELLLKEIGEVLDLTESRVSQIHTRALYRMNRAIRSALGAPEAV